MPSLRWGTIGFNKQQNSWYVKGTFQGERLYYSGYSTILGWKKCDTEAEALQVQLVISSEMERGVFNPLRYKKTKPNHIKNYALEWLDSIKNDLSFATFKAYRAAAHYIISGLGEIYLEDLNYKDIKKWLGSLDLQMKTKKNYQGVLIRMMKDAKRNGDVAQLPDFVE